MLIKSIGQIKMDYIRACDYAFIHTGIDSTRAERKAAEDRLSLATKQLHEQGLIPDDINNPKKCRACPFACQFGAPNCYYHIENNEC